MQNSARLEQAWIDLHEKHNKPGHILFWNQKCGENIKREDFGRSEVWQRDTIIYPEIRVTFPPSHHWRVNGDDPDRFKFEPDIAQSLSSGCEIWVNEVHREGSCCMQDAP